MHANNKRIRLRKATRLSSPKSYGATGRRWTQIYADTDSWKVEPQIGPYLCDRSAELRTFGELSRAVEAFV